MDAFDADVLIYAATPGHPHGRAVLALFDAAGESPSGTVGVGSVLLLPELLVKPLRDATAEQTAELAALLARLDLQPVDTATAQLATALGARYRLAAIDAVHLATALAAGAERFITNNTKDFSRSITEIDITTPDDLARSGR